MMRPLYPGTFEQGFRRRPWWWRWAGMLAAAIRNTIVCTIPLYPRRGILERVRTHGVPETLIRGLRVRLHPRRGVA